MKKLLFLVLFLFSIIFTPQTFAANNSFVSIVNPIRGNDFWNLKDQTVEKAVLGQISILQEFNLPATWLLRFDALDNRNITDELKKRPSDEKGLFLEITPSWAKQAQVLYHESPSWHAAGSAFLTGYEREERDKLIDAAFGRFKDVFGYYPVSVGAWWIDSYSLGYMQKKYGIISALIVADQYSTDNYQIWGQYFGTPYYPAKNNALHPAQTKENKLDVVMMQWALRDPVNGYGNGVLESTFSVQVNDYLDYHDLDIKYFSSLVDIYTKQKFNQFGQLVVGLENSYEWNKYANEYRNQVKTLADKSYSGQFSVTTMKDLSNWYRKTFPNLSPAHIIVADDPLNSYKKTVWFMDPYYRAGWFLNSDGSVFRDIRQYIDGEEELCFKSRCDSVNFATSATRVLDDVSFGDKWILDEGKISDFRINQQGEKYVMSYRNEAKNLREIVFLPRDISLDGNISSIDAAILNATKTGSIITKNAATAGQTLDWSPFSVILKLAEFLLFLLLVIIIPGFVLSRNLLKKDSPFLWLFISGSVGFVVLTLLFYITGLLKIRPLVFVYILISLILYVRFKPPSVILSTFASLSVNSAKDLIIRFFGLRPQNDRVGWLNLILIAIILAGTIFQAIPVFKSGLNFSYGMGFWGPNAHDSVWHMALINQLVKSVPPENPIYSGMVLKNYHFFYDLLIAATNYLSGIPINDLIFRFYPVIFSLMLGVGFYYLIKRLFESKIGELKTKIAAIFSLYLIYFAGSFGWIVEFLRERHFGGESAFWANQAVSFNLNPPFAISLVIIIALLHILFNLSNYSRSRNLVLAILLAGSLIGFKSYGAILILASILFVGLTKKLVSYLMIFIGASLLSIWIFLPNFDTSANLLVFAPFWFIHSMIDSPDRVGWVRLSLARETGLATGNWFKFISAEVLSLLLFIVGNLGLRVVSLLSFIKIKTIIADEKLLFISIFALLSFLIPIVFIQSGNPWNTIQFSYYGLYIASVVSGIVLSLVVIKLPKYISVLLVLAALILAPINSIVTASGYLSSTPHAIISSKELAGLQFLSTQADGIVLTHPYNEKLKQKLYEPWPLLAYDSTAYVSALTGKSVYLEDEPQNQILLTDYIETGGLKKRLVASTDFFLKPLSAGLKFLQDNNIKYVYLPKIYNVRLDESTKQITNIFENEEVMIYKVNK